IAAKTADKVRIFEIPVFTDIGKPIPGFSESACPCKIQTKVLFWKYPMKCVQQFLFFRTDQYVSPYRILKFLIFTTDKEAAIVRCAHIEIWSCRIPDQDIVVLTIHFLVYFRNDGKSTQ